MDDRAIIDLYFAHSERAISETDKKYGRYCRYIATNILHSDTEAEECVDDAYMNTWSAIPPAKPYSLRTYRSCDVCVKRHSDKAYRYSNCRQQYSVIEKSFLICHLPPHIKPFLIIYMEKCAL